MGSESDPAYEKSANTNCFNTWHQTSPILESIHPTAVDPKGRQLLRGPSTQAWRESTFKPAGGYWLIQRGFIVDVIILWVFTCIYFHFLSWTCCSLLPAEYKMHEYCLNKHVIKKKDSIINSFRCFLPIPILLLLLLSIHLSPYWYLSSVK